MGSFVLAGSLDSNDSFAHCSALMTFDSLEHDGTLIADGSFNYVGTLTHCKLTSCLWYSFPLWFVHEC